MRPSTGPASSPTRWAAGWRDRFALVDRTTAFNHIHRPAALDETEPARRRLAFDELFRLQLALVLRQDRLQRDARGIRHVVSRDGGTPTLADQFLDQLPFSPTGAQRRAMADIRDDLAGPLPMHRLLQGDVGSGKTVVAVAALLVAVDGGHQAALMAPTEVLAEQHASEVTTLVEGLSVPDPSTLEGRRPLRVGLLTNKTGRRRPDRAPRRAWPTERSTSSSEPTPSSPTRSGSGRSAWWSSTSSTGSVWSSGPRSGPRAAATTGPVGTPTCWS